VLLRWEKAIAVSLLGMAALAGAGWQAQQSRLDDLAGKMADIRGDLREQTKAVQNLSNDVIQLKDWRESHLRFHEHKPGLKIPATAEDAGTRVETSDAEGSVPQRRQQRTGGTVGAAEEPFHASPEELRPVHAALLRLDQEIAQHAKVHPDCDAIRFARDLSKDIKRGDLPRGYVPMTIDQIDDWARTLKAEASLGPDASIVKLPLHRVDDW
jgi:hypothetical protein